MERESLKQTILAYMEKHNTMALATVRDGNPHVAKLFYVNTGFEIHFLSGTSTRHAEDIARNALVSAAIDEDYQHWPLIKGIQMEGRATCEGGIMENRSIALAYLKKFPDVEDFLFSPQKLGGLISGKMGRVSFFRLRPERVFFIDNEKGFGNREELTIPQNIP